MAPKTKIFVDGNCVVCDMEISHYNRIAPGLFEVIDISDPSFEASRFGLTAQAVNKNMHVMTPEGEVKIGVDAFAHIWSRIEKYRFAAKLIGLPVVRTLARAGYWMFTVVRPFLPKKR